MAVTNPPLLMHEADMPEAWRQWAQHLRQCAPGLDGKSHATRIRDTHLFWPGVSWLYRLGQGLSVFAVLLCIHIGAESENASGPSSLWNTTDTLLWLGLWVSSVAVLSTMGVAWWRRRQAGLGFYVYVTPTHLVEVCGNYLQLYPLDATTRIEAGAFSKAHTVYIHVQNKRFALRTSGWPASLALSQRIKEWVSRLSEPTQASAAEVDSPLPALEPVKHWRKSRPPWGEGLVGLGFVAAVTMSCGAWFLQEVIPWHQRQALRYTVQQCVWHSSLECEMALTGKPSLHTMVAAEKLFYEELMIQQRQDEQRLQKDELILQVETFFRNWQGRLQRYHQLFPQGTHQSVVTHLQQQLDHRLFNYAIHHLDGSLSLYRQLYDNRGLHSAAWEDAMLQQFAQFADELEKTSVCPAGQKFCLRDVQISLLRALHQKKTRTLSVRFLVQTPTEEQLPVESPLREHMMSISTNPGALLPGVYDKAQNQLQKMVNNLFPHVSIETEVLPKGFVGESPVEVIVGGWFCLVSNKFLFLKTTVPLAVDSFASQSGYSLLWMGGLYVPTLKQTFFFHVLETTPRYLYTLGAQEAIVSEDLFSELTNQLNRLEPSSSPVETAE